MFYTGILILFTPTVSLIDGLVWKTALGVGLWRVVGIVVVVFGNSLVRTPLKKEFAK